MKKTAYALYNPEWDQLNDHAAFRTKREAIDCIVSCYRPETKDERTKVWRMFRRMGWRVVPVAVVRVDK